MEWGAVFTVAILAFACYKTFIEPDRKQKAEEAWRQTQWKRLGCPTCNGLGRDPETPENPWVSCLLCNGEGTLYLGPNGLITNRRRADAEVDRDELPDDFLERESAMSPPIATPGPTPSTRRGVPSAPEDGFIEYDGWR
jgi:hypothetical protein